MMHKHGYTHFDHRTTGIITQCMHGYKQWTQLPEILISRYEDVALDLKKEIKRIADFLLINISPSDIDRIAKELSLNEQKKKINEFNYKDHGKGEGSNIYNPANCLYKNHIKSGEINQWRKKLFKIEIAFIEDMAEGWLVENGYEISSKYYMRKMAKYIFPILEKFIARIKGPLRNPYRFRLFRKYVFNKEKI